MNAAARSYGGNGAVQSDHPNVGTLDGIFYRNSSVRIADVQDGLSQTLLFGVQAAYLPGTITARRGLT